MAKLAADELDPRSISMRRLLIPFVLVMAMVAGPGLARAGDVGPRPPGAFDYYVLTLTWVPGFCAHRHGDAECSKQLGFALHGLWPQLEGGDYPSSCSNVALAPQDRAQFAGVYPDPSMIDHEWPKHGTCAGLAPADYFALSKRDESAVTIPAAYRSPRTLRSADARRVRAAFVAANPGLPAKGVNVVVAKGLVMEVEICLTKAGAFRSCAAP
jgi:ribonuclease T2